MPGQHRPHRRHTAQPTYLVGFDGSPAARAALGFARGLAEQTTSRLDVLHVVPSVAPDPDGAAEDEELEQARGEAREAAEATQGTVTEFEAGFGDPDWLLHRRARELSCSLIVVGATHRGPLGQLVPGSLGERLVHGAPCAVVVVPEGAPTAVRRIVVAVDGRTESERAFALARETGASLDAELMLVTVEEPDAAPAPEPGDVPVDQMREHHRVAEERLDLHRASCPPTMRVGTKVASGPTGPTLAGMCTQDTDLLVTGSRGYGPLRGALLGSTSRHLVDHAPCPVLVVPRSGGRSLVWNQATSKRPVA